MLARLRDALIWQGIGLGLTLLALALRHFSRRDDWLRRALADFDAVFRFESGDAARSRYLRFDRGRVTAPARPPRIPDFTFTIYHPEKFKPRGPGGVLEVVISNQVGQTGNLMYVYRFGFIMSLLRRRLRHPEATEAAYG